MDTSIQFRINDETKRLAKLMAESQGRTLSDACKELVENLAEQQRKSISQDLWLTEQINAAFDKFESSKSNFIEHDKAKSLIEIRKNKIRNRDKL